MLIRYVHFNQYLLQLFVFYLLKRKENWSATKWNSFLRIFWIPKSQVFRVLKLSNVLVPLLKFFILRFSFLPILSDFFYFNFFVHVFSFLFLLIFILFVYLFFVYFLYIFYFLFIFYLFIYLFSYFFSDFVYEMSVLPPNVHGRVRREQRGRSKNTNK